MDSRKGLDCSDLGVLVFLLGFLFSILFNHEPHTPFFRGDGKTSKIIGIHPARIVCAQDTLDSDRRRQFLREARSRPGCACARVAILGETDVPSALIGRLPDLPARAINHIAKRASLERDIRILAPRPAQVETPRRHTTIPTRHRRRDITVVKNIFRVPRIVRPIGRDGAALCGNADVRVRDPAVGALAEDEVDCAGDGAVRVELCALFGEQRVLVAG